jgi:hypothetical protein
MTIDLDRAISAKRQNVGALLDKDNVVGVGVGFKEVDGVLTDEVAVTVNVVQKVPTAQLTPDDLVPRQIDGVKTDVVETGRFLAGQSLPPEGAAPPGDMDASTPPVILQVESTRGRWRPIIPPGVSMGHYAITAGTFGCLVRRGSQIFVLSNNHVLANVNSGQPGDAVLQPGRYDGGTENDRVAVLAEYVPIDFGGEDPSCGVATGVEKALNWVAQTLGSSHRLMAYQTTPGQNLVDAALARPLDPAQFTPAIFKIGTPLGARPATLGTGVQKTGRTTDYTRGQIVQIDVTSSVDYGGRVATFTGQLMAGAISAGGDSGSAVLDDERYVIGLLFAGSANSTLINPIETVLRLLNVEIVT